MAGSISDAMNQPPAGLYDTSAIRDMDRYAIDELGVDGYELMTRAAQASLDALRATFPDARRVVVVCGAGNNAGDGYVLARLAMDLGWSVIVAALSNPAKLRNDAGHAWRDYVARGGHTQHYETSLLDECDVVVDALLGTGLTRAVEGEFADVIRSVNASGLPVVSLDVPSGLNSDTGQPQPLAIHATLTITFIAHKIGLFTGRAAAYCGRVECHTLDLPPEVAGRHTPVSRLIQDQDARSCLPRRARDAHKGLHGRVLIVGGNAGMSGAVVLTAAAALRSGAGTATIACHPQNHVVVADQLPEVMCTGVETFEQLDTLLASADVVALGPGLGRDDWAHDMFERVIDAALPTVIDADGLRCLAARQAEVRSGTWLLTPHVGEAAALLGSTSREVADDRAVAAVEIARRFGAVTVVKGANSVVATPDGAYRICAHGNPGMATAGSGDVLTGIAAGVWAQQAAPAECAAEAAAAAVFVHATAGDRAAALGERGLLASDIIRELRRTVNFD